jgi:hypothetical protein
LTTGGSTWTSGDPQSWTNFFVSQQSDSTPGAASPANQNALAAGFADLHVTAVGGNYQAGASMTASSGGRAPASIIAAYTTSEVPDVIGPQFRDQTTTSYANRTDTVIPEPTVFDGDILWLTLFMGQSGGAPPTPTLPAGFTLLDSTTVAQGGFNGVFRVAWKRAAGESGAYTVTHTSAATQATITVYSNCILTGSPVDVYSKAFATDPTSDGATAVATSITTTIPNTKLLFVGHNWTNSGALSPPTDFTERFDGLIYLADKEQVAAGATGAASHGTGNASNHPWSAFLVALKELPSEIAGAEVWDGSAWVEKPVKVWDGSAWVQKPVRTWDGSVWV